MRVNVWFDKTYEFKQLNTFKKEENEMNGKLDLFKEILKTIQINDQCIRKSILNFK